MSYYGKKNPKKNDQQTDLFAPFVSYREEVEEFINLWNTHIWLPKITGTDRQSAAIRGAMERPFFRKNWRQSFPYMAKSTFLFKKMRPAFRIDWFLEPDNFDKILEGFYFDEEHKLNELNRQTTRNGDDEEII